MKNISRLYRRVGFNYEYDLRVGLSVDTYRNLLKIPTGTDQLALYLKGRDELNSGPLKTNPSSAREKHLNQGIFSCIIGGLGQSFFSDLEITCHSHLFLLMFMYRKPRF